jgi:spore coat polysaccharide biosynthesis protein SpsF
MMNVGIISQARVSSSRLPRKTLLPIQGDTLLGLHLKQLQHSGYPVYLATTTEPEANQLIQIAEQLNIKYKIGSLDDVLSRYYLCAKEYALDVIIRVTSDCPLVCGELIKKGIEQYLSLNDKQRVYFTMQNEPCFPRGLDFEIFSFELLEEAYLNCLDMRLREHVSPYIYQNAAKNKIRIDYLRYEDYQVSDWRLCIDTIEDYHLIEALASGFQFLNYKYTDLVDYLKSNEHLKAINQEIVQKSL